MSALPAEERVVVTTRIDVDPGTAFQVFTREVDVWWRHGPRFRVQADRRTRMYFEPGVGGRLVELCEDGSGDHFEHGRIHVWEPPFRLVFEMRGRDFRDDERTEVEVRFEDEDGATRVTVEHRGWEALGPDHPVRHGLHGRAFRDTMSVWWADLLASAAGCARERRERGTTRAASERA